MTVSESGYRLLLFRTLLRKKCIQIDAKILCFYQIGNFLTEKLNFLRSRGECVESNSSKEADGKRFGDWEMDTIVDSYGHAILTMTERSTNFLLMEK